MFPKSILKESILVHRKSGGGYVNGRWVEGVVTTSTHSSVSVQPTSARDLQMLPEGETLEGSVRIFDIEPLYSQDVNAGKEADVVEYNGKRYKVIKVDPWMNGIMDHYEAIAALERQSTGV